MRKIKVLLEAKVIFIILLTNTIYTTGTFGEDNQQGKYFVLKYSPSTIAGELQLGVTYTLWIPEGVKNIRGIIVHQHGSGLRTPISASKAAYDLHWQALSKKWDCALLGPTYNVTDTTTHGIVPGGSQLWYDPRLGSEKSFLKALDEFAVKSGHQELKTVPWILWGHSAGGVWAGVMACLHPERVIAIWYRSGTLEIMRGFTDFPPPDVPLAVFEIPAMCNPGVKEMNWYPAFGSLTTFKEYRAKGAFIGFALDPLTHHECGDCRYLAIPFLDACLSMRLPNKNSKNHVLKPVITKKAWLAQWPGDTAVPAAEFTGNPYEAVWLPNKPVAEAWMEYVKTGSVSDKTLPPAPFNIQVSPGKEKGTKITWNAEADLESGIRCFVILRDGKELAQVPEKPYSQYGRPLFQPLSYHDTPFIGSKWDIPLPEMVYLDSSTNAGEKHIYTVITVNSVGLKSKPSIGKIKK
jgi:pimeloyl-ACP methyl ester carboxylesterase